LYLLTIFALWIDVCWRQFIVGQPLAEFADLAALMAANIFLFIGAVLYYGGVAIPQIRMSAVLIMYFVCLAVGTGVTYLKYHMSSPGEIFERIVLVAAIAGIVVLLYVLAAYFGSKKVDREIEE
jgi:hypothetical protein